MAKILLVEDDLDFAQNLKRWLLQEKHVVDHASSCGDGKHFATSYGYDLAIFDWELPDGSGASLCKELRAAGFIPPVIMLTGRDQIKDRVTGLDFGADDYLCKPCEPAELSARIRSVLRRSLSENETITIGKCRMDLTARELYVDDVLLKLTPTEFAICELLMRNADVSLEPDSLVTRLQVGGNDLSRSSIKVYVRTVRKKFEEANKQCPIAFKDGGYLFSTN